jgi:hypothetical protein
VVSLAVQRIVLRRLCGFSRRSHLHDLGRAWRCCSSRCRRLSIKVSDILVDNSMKHIPNQLTAFPVIRFQTFASTLASTTATPQRTTPLPPRDQNAASALSSQHVRPVQTSELPEAFTRTTHPRLSLGFQRIPRPKHCSRLHHNGHSSHHTPRISRQSASRRRRRRVHKGSRCLYRWQYPPRPDQWSSGRCDRLSLWFPRWRPIQDSRH